MRRDELSALGVELPVFPTIALGALPGDPVWADRLVALGLDVVGSGADEDTMSTWQAACNASRYKPVKARCRFPDALVAAGCTLVESDNPVPAGAYGFGPAEAIVPVVAGDSRQIEDPNEIARPIVEAARKHDASGLWVVATAGLDRLPIDIVEAKLAALVEAAVQARLALAKDQFDL